MALRSLASGGVYICGGIFPKVGGWVGERVRLVTWVKADGWVACQLEGSAEQAVWASLRPFLRPHTRRACRPTASSATLHSLRVLLASLCGGVVWRGAWQVMERVKSGGVLEAFLWRASRFHDKVRLGGSAPLCSAFGLSACACLLESARITVVGLPDAHAGTRSPARNTHLLRTHYSMLPCLPTFRRC
jgi:hypothetical protein